MFLIEVGENTFSDNTTEDQYKSAYSDAGYTGYLAELFKNVEVLLLGFGYDCYIKYKNNWLYYIIPTQKGMEQIH